MTAAFRRLEPRDLETLLRLRAVSFGDDTDEALRDDRRRGLEEGRFWGLVEDGEFSSAATLTLADHWFGGRRVRCQHVGGVAVPPEHRGRGVALATMRGVIAQGLADGAGLSLLFPATSALYRRLGWEHAGHLVRYRLDARHAPARGAALRPVRPDDWPAVQACHEATGRALNGPAARPERDWARVREARFTYVLDAESGPGIEAYVCFGPRRQPGDWQYSVGFADWGATTPRGVTALLGFVGRHGTIGRDAALGGSFPHPWTFVAPEQDLRRDGGMFWMARGLDLPAAVAARGYAPGIDLAVDFRVEDADAPESRGPWRLEVADGGGKLAPTATADVVLDARAIGPLYTGFTSAAQLALAGVASGPERDLALLGTAFAGPPPVLFDFF